MKKIIILLLTLSMLLMGSTACSKKQPDSSQGGANSGENNIYSVLDDLSKKEYDSIKVDIKTSSDFAKLYSTYTLNDKHVIYSIEKLNLLTSSGNFEDLSSNYKTTFTGYALLENGRVVEIDGNNDVVLPTYNELKGNFNFTEDNFENVVVENNLFEADVISPSKFYGTDVAMSNLSVKVEYTEETLIGITLSYTTTNATVETVYAFEN